MKPGTRRGFTLVEMLVVIAIIGILASLMLPGLWRATERARMIQCINNLRQSGIGISLYTADYDDCFPEATVEETNGISKLVKLGIGGFDPAGERLTNRPTASIRPLYPYIPPSEVFHCPKDHGLVSIVTQLQWLGFDAKPTCWETLGCSYVYNIEDVPSPFGRTVLPREDWRGLAGKATSWVPDPTRYILMYEPPAGAVSCHDKLTSIDWKYCFWHFSGTGRPEVQLHNLAHESRHLIAPLLFVDGHARFFDFTRTIKEDPAYPCEPTEDWMWYKPRVESGGGSVGAWGRGGEEKEVFSVQCSVFSVQLEAD
jgi:prepilin-type N-terminal cleavage/methylation domain-containing protein